MSNSVGEGAVAVQDVSKSIVEATNLCNAVARGIAELCAEARLPMYPHNYSLGPSLLANIHWAFTAPAACCCAR